VTRVKIFQRGFQSENLVEHQNFPNLDSKFCRNYRHMKLTPDCSTKSFSNICASDLIRRIARQVRGVGCIIIHNSKYSITATITGGSKTLARQLFLELLFWAWTHEIHLGNFLGHQKISGTCAVVGES